MTDNAPKMIEKKTYFAYRSFLPELETMKRFRAAGIDTFTYLVSNTTNSLGAPYTPYPPIWKWNGVYDMEPFRKQTDDILNAVPDAKLLCMLDLNPPAWWTRYLGAFGVKHDSYYDLGKISGAAMWQHDVQDYLRALIEYAEEHYAEHIVGYVLGGGGATEWHDRSHGEESIYRVAGFRRWQKAHGKEMTGIPEWSRRYSGTHDFDNSYNDEATYYNGIDPTGCVKEIYPDGIGLFRTPAESQDVIDYWQYINESNADIVSTLFHTAKSCLRHPAELGCFFGYCFSTWTLDAGHLAYEKLFACSDVDFCISPIAREHRIGGNSNSATILKTVQLAGKRMLQEMDQRTYTSNRKITDFCTLPDPMDNAVMHAEFQNATDSCELSKKFSMDPGGSIWMTEQEVVAGIKRDSAFCLIEHQSQWWFDMWGGFYQSDMAMETFQKSHEIWEKYHDLPTHSQAQILVVADPENMYLLNDLNPRCGAFLEIPRISASLTGIPYDVCSLRDLPKLSMAQYRLAILCHPFLLTAEKQMLLRDTLFQNDRTILAMHGTTINEDGAWDEHVHRRIWGTAFGVPQIQTCRHEGWTAKTLYRPETLTAEILRELAVEAGCRPYCSAPRAIRANDRFLCVHTAWKETLTITLPRKYRKIEELYTGKAFTDTDHFTLTTTGPETCLFNMEPESVKLT